MDCLKKAIECGSGDNHPSHSIGKARAMRVQFVSSSVKRPSFGAASESKRGPPSAVAGREDTLS